MQQNVIKINGVVIGLTRNRQNLLLKNLCIVRAKLACFSQGQVSCLTKYITDSLVYIWHLQCLLISSEKNYLHWWKIETLKIIYVLKRLASCITPCNDQWWMKQILLNLCSKVQLLFLDDLHNQLLTSVARHSFVPTFMDGSKNYTICKIAKHFACSIQSSWHLTGDNYISTCN